MSADASFGYCCFHSGRCCSNSWYRCRKSSSPKCTRMSAPAARHHRLHILRVRDIHLADRARVLRRVQLLHKPLDRSPSAPPASTADHSPKSPSAPETSSADRPPHPAAYPAARRSRPPAQSGSHAAQTPPASARSPQSEYGSAAAASPSHAPPTAAAPGPPAARPAARGRCSAPGPRQTRSAPSARVTLWFPTICISSDVVITNRLSCSSALRAPPARQRSLPQPPGNPAQKNRAPPSSSAVPCEPLPGKRPRCRLNAGSSKSSA